MLGGIQLKKAEDILRSPTSSNYTDINDILELYITKKYVDNELYLKGWTLEDITEFKQKVTEYGKVIGQFMSSVDDSTIIEFYKETLRNTLIHFGN